MFRAFHQRLRFPASANWWLCLSWELLRSSHLPWSCIFSLNIYRQIPCRQLPIGGLELIVGWLPSIGSCWELQDGFHHADLVVLDCFGLSSLYSECHMWLLPHESWRLTAHIWHQPSCVEPKLISQMIWPSYSGYQLTGLVLTVPPGGSQ